MAHPADCEPFSYLEIAEDLVIFNEFDGIMILLTNSLRPCHCLKIVFSGAVLGVVIL
jgi:hypothetical protein